jgi:hypothetical protein
LLIMSTEKKTYFLPSVESQIEGGNILDSPLIQKNWSFIMSL